MYEIIWILLADCLVPRDCADVLRLGINETGRYRVIPSGDAHSDQIEVSNLTNIAVSTDYCKKL